jgi:hypothetical protein
MKTARLIALWAAISLAAPTPLLFAGSATGASVGNAGGEICFTIGDAMMMLRELEAAPAVKVEADACREWQIQEEARDQTIAEGAQIREARIAELEKEKAAALVQAEENLKAGERAVKVAQGPWYQRVLSVGKWIGLGILVGFAAGMGR